MSRSEGQLAAVMAEKIRRIRRLRRRGQNPGSDIDLQFQQMRSMPYVTGNTIDDSNYPVNDDVMPSIINLRYIRVLSKRGYYIVAYDAFSEHCNNVFHFASGLGTNTVHFVLCIRPSHWRGALLDGGGNTWCGLRNMWVLVGFGAITVAVSFTCQVSCLVLMHKYPL